MNNKTKKIIILLVIVLLAVFIIYRFALKNDAKIEGLDIPKEFDAELAIKFEDENLEKYIREKYNLNEEVIKWGELSKITRLEINGDDLNINSIDDLKWFINLENLSIFDGKNIKGNIKVLSTLEKLEYIYINNVAIEADLADIKDKENIVDLMLYDIKVEGDISNLAKNTGMYKIVLNDPSVNGDISVFSNMPNMLVIDLNNTTVSGDIACLSKLEKLDSLKLDNTNISGDLSKLYTLRNLYSIEIANNDNLTGVLYANDYNLIDSYGIEGKSKFEKVDDPEKIIEFKDKYVETALRVNFDLEGDIRWKDLLEIREFIIFGGKGLGDDGLVHIKTLEDLKWLVNLERIHIEIASEDGDVKAELKELASLNRLKYLNLSGCDVTGEISELNVLKNLDCIIMPYTKVKGNLSSLKELDKLAMIDFEGTDVEGELSDIADLENLFSINLSYTSIKGDIGSLDKLDDLYYLYLNNTLVSGNINSLSDIPNLYNVEINDSNIEGFIKLKNLDNMIIYDENSDFKNEVLYVESQNLDDDENIVDFKDKAFEKFMRAMLGFEDEEIKVKDLRYMKILNIDLHRNKSLYNFDDKIKSLEDLKYFENLEELYIYDKSSDKIASFNAKDLENLSKLKRLIIQSDVMEGDINSIAKLNNLELLDLQTIRLGGNISSINSLNKLNELRLYECCELKGNVNELDNLQELEDIYLGYDGHADSLEDFKNFKKLKRLKLYRSSVAGNLESLKGFENLEEITLYLCWVEGDISSFLALPKLKRIGVCLGENLGAFANDTIHGDIACLSEMKNLKGVYFESCNVYGDVSSLNNLDYINIDRTRVYGRTQLNNGKYIGFINCKSKEW